MAHKYHPDKKGGDEKKFKEVNEAYQVLSNPQKRSQYDKFGSTFNEGGQPGGGGGFGGFDFRQGDFSDFFRGAQGGQPFGGSQDRQYQNVDFDDIFDMFGDAFGFRQRGSRQQAGRGEDIHVNLSVSFYDIARGGLKKIEIKKDIACKECDGLGAKKGTPLDECPTCKGRGQVKESTGSFFGNFIRVTACEACQGSGKIPKEKCPHCKGTGKNKEKQVLEINIPAGIKNGEVLAVKGAGQAGLRGASAGDLYLHINATTDENFKRVGNDILYEMPLKLTDALLGTETTVPTIDGKSKIKIEPGTHDGQEIRLKGLGIYGQSGFGGYRAGDQIVKVNIKMPNKLNKKAKKLVEELAEELD